MSAVLERPAARHRLDAGPARHDATVRAVAAAAVAASLGYVTWLWAAGGGIGDLGGLGRRPHVARPADRPGRRRPPAGAGAADGPRPRRRAGVRAGPACPVAPPRRVHLVHADARPHRPDHLGLRRGRPRRGARRGVGPHRRLPRHAPGRRRAPRAWSWSWSPACARPAPGCATSRGTCCTSTPTSGSGSRCPTSCGPARSSSPPPRPRSTGGRCGRRRRRGPALARRRPAARTLRHRLRVTSVVPEDDDVVSVYLTGRAIDRLAVAAGQFFELAVPLRPRLDAGRTPTRSPPPRTAAACASPSRTSATAAPLVRGLRPGTRAAGRGARSAGSPSGARTRAKVALIGAGRRRHPAARAGRGARPTRRATPCCCSACTDRPLFARELDVLARERGLDGPLAARAPPRPRLVARRGRRPRRRPHRPAALGSPTSPSATSTSAAPRPGPRPSAARSPTPGCPPIAAPRRDFGW